MNENIELWVPVLGHENHYAISSLGRVKSIARTTIVNNKKGVHLQHIRERILKQFLTGKKNRNYWSVNLCVGHGRCKTYKVHILMAMSFMYEQYLELVINSNDNYLIDHKNENRFDNSLSNLQIITHRQNVTKAILHKNPNILIGVTTNGKGFQSRIQYEGTTYNLGTFKTSIEAGEVYQSALKEINLGTFEPPKRKRKRIKSNKIIINPKIAS